MKVKILSLENMMDKFESTLANMCAQPVVDQDKLVSLLTYNKCSYSNKDEESDSMIGVQKMKKLLQGFQGVELDNFKQSDKKVEPISHT